MPVGFLLGTILSFFLAYGPALLIAFSSKARGGQKIKWVLLALLLPILMGGAGLMMAFFLVSQDPELALKLTPMVNILGYVGAWAIYWLFNTKAVATP